MTKAGYYLQALYVHLLERNLERNKTKTKVKEVSMGSLASAYIILYTEV